jgi:hypothetical protein
MFYAKNLPAWERVARVVAGIVMARSSRSRSTTARSWSCATWKN